MLPGGPGLNELYCTNDECHLVRILAAPPERLPWEPER